MNVKKLILTNFRNHKHLELEFKNGVNAIIGPNAIGKTNIVEAIYYLSLARSFRGVDDSDLLRKGSEFASEIQAVIQEGKINRKVKVTISKNARYIFINEKRVSKLSELTKSVNVALFEPKDAMLFKDSPRERRNFLDISLTKRSPAYFDYISKYDKVLRKRNELLKGEKVDENLLETLTEMLIKLAYKIVSYREMYVKDINDILIKIARTLAGEDFKVELKYKPFIENDSNFETNAKQAFKRALESDLRHHSTSIGVHREDFSVDLNGKDIAVYGSQGENRLAALMLKISPYFLIEDRDKKPIVVLDDVMSELDNEHQIRLIEFLKKFEQVFITGTKLDIKGINYYQINKKEVL